MSQHAPICAITCQHGPTRARPAAPLEVKVRGEDDRSPIASPPIPKRHIDSTVAAPLSQLQFPDIAMVVWSHQHGPRCSFSMTNEQWRGTSSTEGFRCGITGAGANSARLSCNFTAPVLRSNVQNWRLGLASFSISSIHTKDQQLREEQRVLILCQLALLKKPWLHTHKYLICYSCTLQLYSVPQGQPLQDLWKPQCFDRNSGTCSSSAE